MAINRENVRKWVKALRSGKYEQARAALRRGNAFCCLGVACDISSLGAWDGEVFKTATDSEVNELPREVAEWLGVDDPNPRLVISDEGREDDAAWLNDYRGWSFAQLADAIERTYLSENQ